MTREEALEWFKDRKKMNLDDKCQQAEDMAIKALEQEPIEVEATKLQMAYNQGFEDCRKAVIDELKKWDWQELYLPIHFKENIIDVIPSVNPQEPKTGWNNHQIACMLADLFGDTCACNYNDIDEWLGELCDFKDTCCPNPVGVGCWEQFLKYSQSRYTECGYEVRDKNALQEPKTGRWIKIYLTDTGDIDGQCSECGFIHTFINRHTAQYDYCPNCGAKMESEV